MVTTRSQDKMTFADKIRAKGFSLADCKFFKLNALFPIMLGLAHATVALWCGSGLAGSVVSAIPVADEKVSARREKLRASTSRSVRKSNPSSTHGGPRVDSTQATIMVAACALYPETMQPLFA